MVKKVPEGTSAYQAAWILDSDEEWEEEEEEDSEEEEGSEMSMDEDRELEPVQDVDSQVRLALDNVKNRKPSPVC